VKEKDDGSGLFRTPDLIALISGDRSSPPANLPAIRNGLARRLHLKSGLQLVTRWCPEGEGGVERVGISLD